MEAVPETDEWGWGGSSGNRVHRIWVWRERVAPASRRIWKRIFLNIVHFLHRLFLCCGGMEVNGQYCWRF